MNESESDINLGWWMGIIFGAIVLLIVLYYVNDAWYRDAVAHSAAEYVLDPKTGNTTWRWKGDK